MSKSQKPSYIVKKIETEKVFKHWFQQLKLIEEKFLKSMDPELSFQIVP